MYISREQGYVLLHLCSLHFWLNTVLLLQLMDRSLARFQHIFSSRPISPYTSDSLFLPGSLTTCALISSLILYKLSNTVRVSFQVHQPTPNDILCITMRITLALSIALSALAGTLARAAPVPLYNPNLTRDNIEAIEGISDDLVNLASNNLSNAAGAASHLVSTQNDRVGETSQQLGNIISENDILNNVSLVV